MKRFILDFAKTTGLYTAVLVAGTILIIITTIAIGYLPYSDRPGPGWYGWRGSVSLQELRFVLQWAMFLVVPTAVVGAFLFLSVQPLHWMHTPLWLVRALGALVAAVLSLIVVGGVGWIIALGAVAAYGAGIIGGFFGGWLLPRYAAPPVISARLGILHRLGVLVLWCAATGLILHPFVTWPWSDPGYALELRFVQLTRGPERLTPVNGLTAEEIAYLTSFGVTGRLIANATFSGCSGPGCRRADRARLLIILERPIDRHMVFEEPTVGTRVIYIQEGSQWRKLPPDEPVSKRMVNLRPAAAARDRFMFQVQGQPWQTADPVKSAILRDASTA